MKRNYLMLIAALMVAYLPVSAQSPVITEANFSSVGDTFTLHMADTTSFSVGSAGANQTWDLSGITLNGDTLDMEAITPAGTPYATDFGAANVAYNEGGVYRYYTLNSGGYNFYGEGYIDGGITIEMQHTTPEKLASFPMDYQDTIKTNIHAYTTASGSSIERKGTTTVIADGYGTLMLPGNRNYNDVLRIKVMRMYTDSLNPFGTPFYTDGTQEIYYWYSASEEGYLARFQRIYEVERNTSTVKTKITAAGVVLEGSGQVGISQQTQSLKSLRIMPNPATDRIMVSYTVEENKQVKMTLFNLLGKSVMQQTVTANSGMNQEALNVGNLPRGIYLLNIETGNAVSTQRVVLR